MTASEARRWWGRPGPWPVVVGTIVVGLPLVVAAVALRGRPWHPVLDLAMTEFRVRDVGTAHTPLIGLPGRIGTYPEQGSHPGPLSFYLLAPTYRLLGKRAWGLEVGTVVIHVAALVVALWIGQRRLGWRGVAGVALLLAVVVRGYGQVVLTQPWNPYLPLVAWMVVLLAAWSVLEHDHWMLVALVAAGSYCAQTHVPYLPLAAGMVGVGAVAVAAHRVAPERFSGSCDATNPVDVHKEPSWLPLVVAGAVGVVLWTPPLADQLTEDPGNLRQLIDHFASPPEAALGVGEGLRLALRHLDVWAGVAGQLAGTGRFLSATSPWRGAAVLAVWAGAAVLARRIGSPALRHLHVVVAAGLVLGAVSMARIFGRPWFYLTLWAWGVTTLLVGAVAWTVLAWWRTRRPPAEAARTTDVVAWTAAGVAAVVSLASAVGFADADHPEERLSDAVGALAGPTFDAVVEGVGAADGDGGRYLVRWSDAADIGSPGFGLLDELERRGLDVAGDTYFHVPATDHRTRPRTWADAQIHLATGGYVDVWRARPDAAEVATYDPRTPDQRAEYAAIRAGFAERLENEGLGELVELIDTNLFGMSVDARLSDADQADLTRLIELGQPMAVFIAPPPADDDPGAL